MLSGRGVGRLDNLCATATAITRPELKVDFIVQPDDYSNSGVLIFLIKQLTQYKGSLHLYN